MIRTSFIAATLVLGSALSAFAMGCDKHAQPAMTCANGTVYDADSQSCVPIAS